jgi:hypothetical protein
LPDRLALPLLEPEFAKIKSQYRGRLELLIARVPVTHRESKIHSVCTCWNYTLSLDTRCQAVLAAAFPVSMTSPTRGALGIWPLHPNHLARHSQDETLK